jgi:5-methylcytosine-specific restriction endonuclease McrA
MGVERKNKRRLQAAKVDCPKCGAAAGFACIGVNGDNRKAAHMARYQSSKRPGAVPPAEAIWNRSSAPLRVVAQPVGFYQSDAWRHVRYLALKKHGAACQCCGATGRKGHPLHVDHIKPRSKFPDLELDLSNLQVLCEDCNLGKRAWDDTDWRRA